MLRAESVSFGYDGGFTLSDASVAITAGSLTGLLGPNGCGKTTLLKLLSGVLRPRSGRVMLGDRVLSSMTRRELARHVASVPQETHPAFDYTVMEMVLMGRHPHLSAFQLEGPADFEIARQALDATGTRHLADRNYMTLSGGEKQRVVIASALAQSTEVLLLDEPTASLDLGYQLDVASLLSRLNRERNVTMVLATHDLNLVASLCRTPGGHARRMYPGRGTDSRRADRRNRAATLRRRCGRAVPSARWPPYGHSGPENVLMPAAPGSLSGEHGIGGRLASVLIGYGALALAACLLAPLAGSTHISLARAFDRSIPFPDNVDAQIFFVARMPRVLTGAIVGRRWPPPAS
jgi:iron complex transport system ATP-binding protein